MVFDIIVVLLAAGVYSYQVHWTRSDACQGQKGARVSLAVSVEREAPTWKGQRGANCPNREESSSFL